MKSLKKLIAAAILIFAFSALSAQTPPPPNGNGSNPIDNGNTPVGGGAPIGGGLIIMMALGMGYGTKKVYDFRNNSEA